MTEDGPPADDAYLAGQLLLAMPTMRDPRFARTVIYMCAHSAEGAIGLVINRLVDSLSFAELAASLDIEADPAGAGDMPKVHFGGPVETERGFVLHSRDYMRRGSMPIDERVALTATLDILRDIADGRGPRDRILALGYAGWGPGQLDGEIRENAWLSAPSDGGLLFDADLDGKWSRAMARIGVDAALLSSDAGRA